MKIKNNDKYQQIRTIDLHTAGEPLRLITAGVDEPRGQTVLEKRRFMQENMDQVRQILMYEPRGHADMYGALLTEPERVDSDFGIIFMHNEGYSSMCGHGIIAVVTALVETGIYPITHNHPIRIDSPAGLITAYINEHNGQVSVSFECVPSFVSHKDITVCLEDGTEVVGDICFGGAYYFYVNADQLGLELTPSNVETLKHLGQALKVAASEQYEIVHPHHADLSFLYGTIFTSASTSNKHNHSKHVCIFAESEVDRSPTGTGVSGRIALLVDNGEVEIGQSITIESITSSNMTVKAIRRPVADQQAIIPIVSGQAFVTAEQTFYVDDFDNLRNGFLLR